MHNLIFGFEMMAIRAYSSFYLTSVTGSYISRF